MIGQHVDPFNGAQRPDKGSRLTQIRFVVRQPGHQNAADPGRLPDFREITGTVQDRVVPAPGHPTVKRVAKGFQIQKNRVGCR